MMTAYLVLLLAVVAWKGYLACRHNDRLMHDSLREYLLGNGATTWQSLWPFYRHALQRAFLPLLSMWRLWLLLLLLGVLVVWLT